MKQKNENTRVGDSASEDFASMYEKSFAGMASFRPGQLVETRILSISKDTIFLQMSGKSEGLLDREELTDKDGVLTVKAGDPIKVFFMEAKNGEMRFTTRLSGDSAGPSMLEQAYRNQIPVEGLVEKEIKGGYEIKIGASRAFCPFSQMGERGKENSSEYMGKNLTFRIMEFKENGRNILVSNRVFHEELRLNNLEALKLKLKENMTVRGVIKSLQDFGAFVDLEGIQALLPISEIGRSRVEDIQTVLSVGQEIEAVILKIDWKNERITLSMKGLLADPWDKAAEKYSAGSRHSGKIARITDFGAFVTLEPGLDGLIPISEIRESSKFTSSNNLTVKIGQTLTVKILEFDRIKKRISLKPALTLEEEATSAKYMESGSDGETYNPFAALLKKKG